MCENVVHGTEHDHENRKNGRMCLQSSTMSEHIEITPEIIEIRHYLHAHPERSFKEYETSAYIEKLLRAHDIEVLNNPLETGVVGLIRGDQPGPRIALRADIDGLPIQEDTGLPFSSVKQLHLPVWKYGHGRKIKLAGSGISEQIQLCAGRFQDPLSGTI